MEKLINLIVTAVLLCPVVIIIANAAKQEYDERQTLVHGNAFKYGFVSQAVFSLFYILLSHFADLSLIGADIVLCLTVVIGICVICCYCVWKDAFFGIDTDDIRLMRTLMIIALFGMFYGRLGLWALWITVKEGYRANMNLLLFIPFMSTGIFVVLLNILAKLHMDGE